MGGIGGCILLLNELLMLMIFKLSDNQPIDSMKADYCVVVWAANLSEQTLFDLPLRHFDLTND